METNKQTEGGELYGNSEQLKPRPINTLKPNEAIQVNNDAERDAILKLMDDECLVWMSGSLPVAYTPNTFPDWIGLSEGRIVHRCDRREHILPASDFLPTEPTEQQIDWTRPQPFPHDYVVPEGIKVVKIGMDDEWVKKGSIGMTLRPSSSPSVKWENSDYDLRGSKLDWLQPNINLAPINPTEHPLHPEFKGAKVEAKEEQNPTQPIDYKSLFHQAQSKVDELQAKVEDLNDSYEFDRAQRSVHREIIREKIINYAKDHPSSHSAQLLGELILDGLI